MESFQKLLESSNFFLENVSKPVNGNVVLGALSELQEPSTLTDIVRNVASTYGKKPESVQECVKSTLNVGVRYGFIEKHKNRYFCLSDGVAALQMYDNDDNFDDDTFDHYDEDDDDDDDDEYDDYDHYDEDANDDRECRDCTCTWQKTRPSKFPSKTTRYTRYTQFNGKAIGDGRTTDDKSKPKVVAKAKTSREIAVNGAPPAGTAGAEVKANTSKIPTTSSAAAPAPTPVTKVEPNSKSSLKSRKTENSTESVSANEEHDALSNSSNPEHDDDCMDEEYCVDDDDDDGDDDDDDDEEDDVDYRVDDDEAENDSIGVTSASAESSERSLRKRGNVGHRYNFRKRPRMNDMEYEAVDEEFRYSEASGVSECSERDGAASVQSCPSRYERNDEDTDANTDDGQRTLQPNECCEDDAYWEKSNSSTSQQ